MLIMALHANRFIAVLSRPTVDRLHALRRDSLTSELRPGAVEPGEKDGRLQLESQKKTDRTIIQPGYQLKYVVTSAESPAKGFDIAGRPENLIVKYRHGRQIFRPYTFD